MSLFQSTPAVLDTAQRVISSNTSNGTTVVAAVITSLYITQIRRKGSLAADKERPWIDLTATGFQLGALLGCYAMRYGYEKVRYSYTHTHIYIQT
jgi:hypothetical protein